MQKTLSFLLCAGLMLPLASCKKLRYAELQTTAMSDLSPLAELTNLTDLNICYNFALHDITPLYGLPNLRRLYIGCLTPVPPEQIARMQELHPDCFIETETIDPTSNGWRYTGRDAYNNVLLDPTYEELRNVMEYRTAPYCYAYPYNDPLLYN